MNTFLTTSVKKQYFCWKRNILSLASFKLPEKTFILNVFANFSAEIFQVEKDKLLFKAPYIVFRSSLIELKSFSVDSEAGNFGIANKISAKLQINSFFGACSQDFLKYLYSFH
jgi:hypothetical protein